MSWKTIFASARRMGAPVIVTDADGNEPMVVLPLSVYEGSAKTASSSFEGSQATLPSPAPTKEEKVHFEAIADAATESFQRDVQAALADFELPEDGKVAEISLEERFYLEPLDGEQEMI